MKFRLTGEISVINLFLYGHCDTGPVDEDWLATELEEKLVSLLPDLNIAVSSPTDMGVNRFTISATVDHFRHYSAQCGTEAELAGMLPRDIFDALKKIDEDHLKSAG